MFCAPCLEARRPMKGLLEWSASEMITLNQGSGSMCVWVCVAKWEIQLAHPAHMYPQPEVIFIFAQPDLPSSNHSNASSIKTLHILCFEATPVTEKFQVQYKALS